MLSSCANPSCFKKFRYLHEGKLFLLSPKHNEKPRSSTADGKHVDQLRYAWLCDRCARTHEVVLDTEERIRIRPRFDLSELAAG